MQPPLVLKVVIEVEIAIGVYDEDEFEDFCESIEALAGKVLVEGLGELYVGGQFVEDELAEDVVVELELGDPADELVEVGHVAELVEEADHEVPDYHVVRVLAEQVNLLVVRLLVLLLYNPDQCGHALRQRQHLYVERPYQPLQAEARPIVMIPKCSLMQHWGPDAQGLLALILRLLGLCEQHTHLGGGQMNGGFLNSPYGRQRIRGLLIELSQF